MNKVIVDTGFWYALYDERDEYHQQAIKLFEYLSMSKIIIPFPSLYETINTRFAKKRVCMEEFEMLLKGENVVLLDDTDYKDEALELTIESSKLKKPYSLVDMIIRLMLSDNNIDINYMLTFNKGDFIDVCLSKQIEILS